MSRAVRIKHLSTRRSCCVLGWCFPFALSLFYLVVFSSWAELVEIGIVVRGLFCCARWLGGRGIHKCSTILLSYPRPRCGVCMQQQAVTGAKDVAKKVDLGIDHSRPLFREHMVALLKKRLLTFKRDKKMWAFVVLMPALFVLIGVLILLSVTSKDEPSLLLTPEVSMSGCTRGTYSLRRQIFILFSPLLVFAYSQQAMRNARTPRRPRLARPCTDSQDFNSGGAPFPYGAQCTVSNGTCDAADLVAEMNFPEQADAITLDLTSASDEDEAVGLVSRLFCQRTFKRGFFNQSFVMKNTPPRLSCVWLRGS